MENIDGNPCRRLVKHRDFPQKIAKNRNFDENSVFKWQFFGGRGRNRTYKVLRESFQKNVTI